MNYFVVRFGCIVDVGEIGATESVALVCTNELTYVSKGNRNKALTKIRFPCIHEDYVCR